MDWPVDVYLCVSRPVGASVSIQANAPLLFPVRRSLEDLRRAQLTSALVWTRLTLLQLSVSVLLLRL